MTSCATSWGKGNAGPFGLSISVMKLLFVDTSTSACSLALADDGVILAELLLNQRPAHSSLLASALERILSLTNTMLSDLDGFGVTVGPGAFTGLRVGLSLVKGLAWATGKPVAPVSSLALLAANLPWAASPVCALFDARRGEVYAGLYRSEPLPVPLMPDQTISPDLLLSQLPDDVLFAGDGALRYADLIQARFRQHAAFAPSAANLPRAAAGIPLAAAAFARNRTVPAAALLPEYHRLSEAEQNLQRAVQ